MSRPREGPGPALPVRRTKGLEIDRRTENIPRPVGQVLPVPSLAGAPPRADNCPHMEFLNFLLILWTAWLLWRRPERERLAFRLLVLSCLLMALLFLIGTHTSWVPGVNI